MGERENNPLRLLWNVLGTIGGVISLSSMVQSWIADLVKWKGFILTIIESYQAVIRPFFSFIFQWFPFSVPFWIQDYLVFGLIVAAATYRAYRRIRKKLLAEEWGIVTTIVAWPAWIGFVVWKGIYLYYKRKKRPTFVQHNPSVEFTHRAMLWVGTILLGCVVLLSINASL